jgi:DNA (cytosine-5)-methyltransferase 1
LFAGAGLFGHAFASEGFAPRLAIEMDAVAAKSYAANLGDAIIVADARSASAGPRCDVLIGGPPCQGFSTLGKRREDDPRNALCLEMPRWARMTKARVVVVENVAAFLRSEAWEEMAGEFEMMGFEVEAALVNAKDFGVAQMRSRSITFASKIGLPKIKRGGKKTNVKDAWEGLPDSPDGRNLHFAPVPSDLALARMKLIPYGGDKRDVLIQAPRLAPQSWLRTKNEVTDVWGRMRWDRPANTIRTSFLNPSKGRYLHPEQDRVITLREGARLQSIPDSYVLCGKPTQMARQIGNGVPVLMGRAIAQGVAEATRPG